MQNSNFISLHSATLLKLNHGQSQQLHTSSHFFTFIYTYNSQLQLKIYNQLKQYQPFTLLVIPQNTTFFAVSTGAIFFSLNKQTIQHFFDCLPAFSPHVYSYFQLHEGHNLDLLLWQIKHYSQSPSPTYSIEETLRIHSLFTHFMELLIHLYQSKDIFTKPIPSYLKKIKNSFDTHYQNKYSIPRLCEHYHISRCKLTKDFKMYYHETPIEYLIQQRIRVAKHLLSTSSLSIYEIGIRIGIPNTNHFIEQFKKRAGITPARYRSSSCSCFLD